MLKKLSVFFLCIFLISIVTAGGCSTEKAENGKGFAIYLTKDDIPPDRMEMLSHIEIADEPLISEKAIFSYDAGTHEIKLTSGGYERINNLHVPTSGKSFIVCVNESPVYWGAFWAVYSSASFDGVTIMTPLMIEPQITLGYPSEGFFTGDDPRNNPEIMKALDQAGKLINANPATFVASLPDSMKGYELYSWKTNDAWNFRLITGTNRNKTLEEVTEGQDTITDLVSLHVTGVDALETLLDKLPENEDVIWLSRIMDGTVTDSTTRIELPDKPIIDQVRHYAGNCGINLVIPSLN